MPIRVVVVVKRVSPDRTGTPVYQAHLRQAAGGNVLFYSRRAQTTSGAKREAERLFGHLAWQEPPAALRQSEPECNQVAYLNLENVPS